MSFSQNGLRTYVRIYRKPSSQPGHQKYEPWTAAAPAALFGLGRNGNIDVDVYPLSIQLLKEFVADIGWGDTFEAGLRLVGHSTPSKDITELASDFVQRKFETSEPFPRLLELLEA